MDLIYGLFFVEVTIELELFLFFLAGRRKSIEHSHNRLINILGIYFLFLAIGRAFLIYYDYGTLLPENLFYYLGTAFSLLGLIFFIYLAEIIIPINTHYIFTLLCCATLISIFFVDLDTAKDIQYIMIPFIFLIGFVFLGYLIRKSAGSVRYNFILVFIGQLIFGAGQTLNTDWISNWFLNELSFNIEIYGLIAIIGGLILIALAFWRLPSFTELDWHAKMLQLFVIANKGGICIVHYTFKETSKESVDSDLVSSGVAGIMAFIKEITSSKMHLIEVDHEDIQLLFEYGQYTTTTLLAEDSLQVYHHKLKLFVEKFEQQFEQHLKKWTGSITEFRPAVTLIGKIFEQKFEKRAPLPDITS